MELIYFISGILTVGIIYGVILLRQIKSSHTDLLARHQSQSNISSIKYGDIAEDLKTVEDIVMDISSKMEKDQYESLTEINQRIKELDSVVYKNVGTIQQSNQVFNKNIADAFSEITQLKNNIKILGQDPNVLDRY
jgi:hypothetical protein|tara:strand:+ start:129 stop:536 length:408 start_codon:yes stop_codon:yes gene_type:complete